MWEEACAKNDKVAKDLLERLFPGHVWTSSVAIVVSKPASPEAASRAAKATAEQKQAKYERILLEVHDLTQRLEDAETRAVEASLECAEANAQLEKARIDAARPVFSKIVASSLPEGVAEIKDSDVEVAALVSQHDAMARELAQLHEKMRSKISEKKKAQEDEEAEANKRKLAERSRDEEVPEGQGASKTARLDTGQKGEDDMVDAEAAAPEDSGQTGGTEEAAAGAANKRLTAKASPEQIAEIKKQSKLDMVQVVERKAADAGNAVKKGGTIKGGATKGKQRV